MKAPRRNAPKGFAVFKPNHADHWFWYERKTGTASGDFPTRAAAVADCRALIPERIAEMRAKSAAAIARFFGR